MAKTVARKGKNKGKNKFQLYNLDAEKLGVAVVYHRHRSNAKIDVVQHDNRNITLSLRSKGGTMNLTGTHAPHSAKPSSEKIRYYEKLREITTQYGRHNQHIILGDFNAKLLKSLPEEREHIGPHIFNPDDQNIDSLPEAQMENRELFVEFCLEEDYVVSSTMFQKHHNDLITFRNTQAATFASPFTNTRFSQIDHILSKRRWRNAIRNVNATHHTSLESDHKMIVVDVVIKLAKQTKKSTAHAPKYREPSDEQRLKYNQIIRQLQGCPPQILTQPLLRSLLNACKKQLVCPSRSFPQINDNLIFLLPPGTLWNLDRKLIGKDSHRSLKSSRRKLKRKCVKTKRHTFYNN
jgi:endonuclease/exonuclease/phosphatase family metal-dependent hydrolase